MFFLFKTNHPTSFINSDKYKGIIMFQYKYENQFDSNGNNKALATFIDSDIDCEDTISDLVNIEELTKSQAIKVVCATLSVDDIPVSVNQLVTTIIQIVKTKSDDLDNLDTLNELANWSTDIIDTLINTKICEYTPVDGQAGFITTTLELTKEVEDILLIPRKMFPSLLPARLMSNTRDPRYHNKDLKLGVYTKSAYDYGDREFLDVLNIQGIIPLAVDLDALYMDQDLDFEYAEDEDNHLENTSILHKCVDHVVSEGNVFYTYPVVDSRVRLYCGNHILNYQGKDYAKSLINFSEGELVKLPEYTNVRKTKIGYSALAKGKVLFKHTDPDVCNKYLVDNGYPSSLKTEGSLYWVKVQLATTFDIGKVTLDTRVNYITDHIDDLDSMVDSADDKHLYAKALRDYRKAIAGELVYGMVHLDASCSAAQIMGLLSGSVKDLKHTNMVESDTFYDPYMEVFNRMLSSPKFSIEADLTRKLVKGAIMPSFYGSYASPEEAFYHSNDDQFDMNLKIFHKAMKRVLPGTVDVMEVMSSVINQDPNVQEQSWTLPDGVIARSIPYTKQLPSDDSDYVSINDHYTTDITVQGYTFEQAFKVKKQCGIELLANVVQSIDGYLVREVIRRCDAQLFSVLTIHDSFACHYNNASNMSKVYLDIMKDLGDLNLLDSILKDLNPSDEGYCKFDDNISDQIVNSTQHIN